MNSLRFVFAAVALVGGMRAQTPLPPFDLGLTINDGVSDVVYRGWPLLFRGDAVLMRDVAAPFTLDLPSLILAIAPARGPALVWPLRRVTEFAAAPTLGPANDSVRVVWLLTAEQSETLLPGDYTATFSWAGRSSPPVTFSVAVAPATLPPDDDIRHALLESQTLLYLDRTTEALAALVPAETRYPDSIDLLVQRGRAHVQRGEFREALRATQRARAIFDRQYPDASHSPRSTIEVEAKARAGLARALAGNLPRFQPTSSAPRTVSMPSNAERVPATVAAVSSPRSPAAPLPGASPAGGATASTPPVLAATAPIIPSLGTVVASAEISEAKIRADAGGQWAATATAGSQYGRAQYSASQATGAPNVPVAGNSPDAWCPATRDKGVDWLEVTFANPVYATEVRVRQNDAPGAITKVEAIEPDGTAHVWWEGIDPYQQSAVREIVWFAVRVPKTSYIVGRVKLTLNLASGPGYKEIDAVQLVSATP